MTTLKNYEMMTNEELRARVNELEKILDSLLASDIRWKEAYMEYEEITMEQDARYRKENQKSFDDFYNRSIKGKKWEEIDPQTWGFYSDWHKDMYGFRPRHI